MQLPTASSGTPKACFNGLLLTIARTLVLGLLPSACPSLRECKRTRSSGHARVRQADRASAFCPGAADVGSVVPRWLCSARSRVQPVSAGETGNQCVKSSTATGNLRPLPTMQTTSGLTGGVFCPPGIGVGPDGGRSNTTSLAELPSERRLRGGGQLQSPISPCCPHYPDKNFLLI